MLIPTQKKANRNINGFIVFVNVWKNFITYIDNIFYLINVKNK